MPIDPTTPGVAHGTRRDEVHYEDDPNHVAKASHLFKPRSPGGAPPGEDVAVLAEGPSVWDASPPEPER